MMKKVSRNIKFSINENTRDNETWVKQEIESCKFKDTRLNKRFQKLCESLYAGIGESIPYACQDWANTKAAYRFFSNDRINEEQILSGHFLSTKERVTEAQGNILILHDTTEFKYKRDDPRTIGLLTGLPKKRDLFGKLERITTHGVLMHSSLAVTTLGLPLGLAAIKFFTRKKFIGSNELKRHINPTRIPIDKKESFRWLENLRQATTLINDPSRCIHIGDRESDIYELFCEAQKAKTHFLVRTCVDRLAGDGNHTIAAEMSRIKVKGLHRTEVRDNKGNVSQAKLKIKYHSITVLPPVDKSKHYPKLQLTVIHAEEKGKPKNRDKIMWKLLTDLPVTSLGGAIEKLNWYAMRWKIELFHKILKSGCKAESSKLRTANRIANLIAIFCILSWRIFWMTMLNRTLPNAASALALTEIEIKLLDNLINNNGTKKKRKLSDYLISIAKLGGYLARNSDAPPGNIVMWRGLTRLIDIELGFNMAMKIVGN